MNEELKKELLQAKRNIDNIKDLLEQTQKQIDTLAVHYLTSPENKTEIQDWMKDRVELWCRIHKEGGIIPNERVHEIWTAMGNDTRGLGGFYVGNGRSLIKIVGDKVALAEHVPTLLQNWTGQTIEEYSKKFT